MTKRMQARLEQMDRLSDQALAEMHIAAVLLINKRNAIAAICADGEKATFDALSWDPTVTAVATSYLHDNEHC